MINNGKFLVGKSDKNSSTFDVLLYAYLDSQKVEIPKSINDSFLVGKTSKNSDAFNSHLFSYNDKIFNVLLFHLLLKLSQNIHLMNMIKLRVFNSKKPNLISIEQF